jgi:hypothetical protein
MVSNQNTPTSLPALCYTPPPPPKPNTPPKRNQNPTHLEVLCERLVVRGQRPRVQVRHLPPQLLPDESAGAQQEEVALLLPLGGYPIRKVDLGDQALHLILFQRWEVGRRRRVGCGPSAVVTGGAAGAAVARAKVQAASRAHPKGRRRPPPTRSSARQSPGRSPAAARPGARPACAPWRARARPWRPRGSPGFVDGIGGGWIGGLSDATVQRLMLPEFRSVCSCQPSRI